MLISNHFKRRYCLRLLNIPEGEIHAYVKQNDDYLNDICITLFESSTWLWRGSINDNAVSNFFVADTTVIVTDEQNEKLVTVWNSDFGFSDKTNKRIVKDIIDDIHGLRKKHEKACQKINSDIKKLESAIDVANEQIRLLEIQSEVLVSRSKSLKNQVKQLNEEPILINAQIDFNAVKLFNALDYKIDMMNSSKAG